MKIRIGHLLLLFLGVSMAASAQDARKFESTKKGSLFGLSFDLTDFVTPNRIMNSSLGHVVSHGEWAKWPDHDLGFSAMFWQGISSRLDVSFQYNGIFARHLKTDNPKKYVNELEGAFHLRALKDDHLFNPFLTAGIGAGYYGWKMAAYTPLGIGVQANLHSRTYFFLEANYRLSLARNVIDDNLFYSVGIAQNFGKKRHRSAPKPAPVPVVVDADNDGVPDSVDACPGVAGLSSMHGCPDSDGDGVADKDDRCPNQTGTAKYQGCPIPDSDGDGVNDEQDKCPNQAGVAKYQGCPIPDSDGDGVNDEMDKCPGVAGPASNNGCPEVKKEQVDRASYAAKHIFFATGKAVLLKQSFKSLDEIATLMEGNPTLKLDINGYTDNTGTPQRNEALSQSRADAVKAYLVKKNVAEDRLTAKGFGEANPVATNKTAAGRAKNRRVELQLKAY
jgi:outer membrane protein OmpA-like peptidoglycan-associated protein